MDELRKEQYTNINKYRSICTIEIILIEKSIGNNIYQINFNKKNEKKINS